MIYLDNDKVFAVFRLPETDESCLMMQEDSSIHLFGPESMKEPGFMVHPFITDTGQTFFIKADQIYYDKEFVFIPNNFSNTSSLSKEDYLKIATVFIEAVKSDFEKLVLSRTKSINSVPGNIYSLYQILCKRYPNAFVFVFNHPVSGTWAGASPEILISGNENFKKTIALAGTQMSRENVEPQWSSKEIQEQASVMNYIEDTLMRKNIDFQKKGPFNKIAAKFESEYLIHLATEYIFFSDTDIYDLLFKLHPTPAVCGLPKQQALAFITEHEKHKRKYYSGFLGPINYKKNEELHLFVNLRSMEVFSNEFLLYLGGGLNDKSSPEKEWEETENKAKTLETAINEYLIKLSLP